ncbi:AmmeMemoRadiSam system radical SAM enzyme [Candidatus Sumerlaeota bacterium]|nr:AmmeMemoRadiSam system radical SAM enzyme [Candidatus Sumerlaeota bacterium]
MKEAMLYEKLGQNAVQCNLCQIRCRIDDGKTGVCGVRKNIKGTLYSLVYEKAVATNVDPIEKKPLFHFLPGSLSYSMATVGCNFHCVFCQNSDIAHMPRDEGRIIGRDIPPKEIVNSAIREGCRSISYTYTEPTIFFEYAYDTAKIAHEEGLKNVFVSNGYMTPEAVETIAPYLDAINVDLKAYDDKIYHKYMGADLEKMKESMRAIYKAGVWMEITTLIVPTLNDAKEQITGIVDFIYGLNPNIPWHISRFHPSYKFTSVGPTPIETLRMAQDIGIKKGLHFIYLGNVWGEDGEDTTCPICGALLIKRLGFNVMENKIRNGKCPKCNAAVPGIYQ